MIPPLGLLIFMFWMVVLKNKWYYWGRNRLWNQISDSAAYQLSSAAVLIVFVA